jgi:hypothetical protein
VDRYIVQPGSLLSAVTTFPSTTGPAHIPFVTGRFAGTADVLGYRWLDRARLSSGWFHPFLHRSYSSVNTFLLPRDMNPDCLTLFELFERPGQVMGLVRLCRNKPLRQLFWRFLCGMGVGHFTGRWELADSISERTLLSYTAQGCDFIYAVFYGIDEVTHLCSPFDERVLQRYERADRAVGRLAELLAARGTLSQSLLAVVSDHGQSPTTEHIGVVDRLKAHGFKPLYYPFTFFPPYDSAVMESGNGMCMIYFLDHPRDESKSDEELYKSDRIRSVIGEFTAHPGISFTATRARDGAVVLRGGGGTIRFHKEADTFEIEVSGRSLLSGSGAPTLRREHDGGAGAIGSGRYTDEDLFCRTLQTPYPDLFAQYWALFSSRRCGDLVVSATPGYDFRSRHEHPVHHSSHGSIRWEHMVTPFALNVPLSRTDPIRTADVFPLICRLCGKDLPHGARLDGRLAVDPGHRPEPEPHPDGSATEETPATPALS